MLTITGRTRLAAVIGDPVTHSLSPTVHNAAFAALDLDWAYLALAVRAGNGGVAVEAMRTLGLGGLSVTMPHKGEVLAGADRRSDAAVELGAANCLAWSGSEIVAHNTDGDGFVRSLEVDAGFDVSGRRAVVLGAGGAARAVVRSLARAGVGAITVVNRTAGRAAEVVVLAPEVSTVGSVDHVVDADLVVNATSVGMGLAPDDPAALPIPVDLLSAGQTVVDLVYTPVTTALLAAAAAAGANVVDGVGMLVHQAAAAFTLWTGEDAPLSAMHAAAREAVDAV